MLDLMRTPELNRLVSAHRAYASAIEQHMAAAWARELTPEEVNTVRSYTLCGSFMSLESIERGLSGMVSAQTASSELAFMKSEVDRRWTAVTQQIQRCYALHKESLQPSQYPNLLAWEEAVLVSQNEV